MLSISSDKTSQRSQCLISETLPAGYDPRCASAISPLISDISAVSQTSHRPGVPRYPVRQCDIAALNYIPLPSSMSISHRIFTCDLRKNHRLCGYQVACPQRNYLLSTSSPHYDPFSKSNVVAARRWACAIALTQLIINVCERPMTFSYLWSDPVRSVIWAALDFDRVSLIPPLDFPLLVS